MRKIDNQMDFVTKSKFYRVSLILAIITLCFMLVNQTSFLHYHINSDGIVVVHSHPSHDSAKSGNKESAPVKHSHSNSEYYFYNTLTHFDKFILATVHLVPFYYKSRTIVYVANDNLNSFIFYSSLYLRAPPVC